MPRKKAAKSKGPKYEAMVKKIKKMYENYGLNTSDMPEDEWDRLYKAYSSPKKNIDQDLKESEKVANMFGDDDIIG